MHGDYQRPESLEPKGKGLMRRAIPEGLLGTWGRDISEGAGVGKRGIITY